MRHHLSRTAVAVLAALTALAASCATTPPGTPEEQVDDLIAFVERSRGHDFATDPVVQFVDPATFEADVLANLAAEEAGIAPDEPAFVALDWIDESEDLVTEFRAAYGGGVVGYYDPADGTLKVRGTNLSPYRREVIAHELTHALDDQVHDLGDILPEGLLDSEYLAALIAIEGSAELVRSRYFDSLSPLEQAQSIQEQLNAGSGPGLFDVPVAILTLSSSPYLRGVAFQRQLVGALGNPAGPDLSLTRYPANTEQGFDTAKYLADEPEVPVPAPPTEGGAPVVRSGGFGPYLLSMVLREGVVLDILDPLTAGWAGGAYTSWEAAGDDCIRVDSAWDSSAEAADMAGALSGWGSLHAGTVVEMPTPSTVRLTRCD
jgi:hypothetical protein